MKAEELEDLGWDILERAGRNTPKKLKQAQDYFRQALAIDADFADAYNGLGIIQSLRGRYSEAEAMHRAALEKARAGLGTDEPQAFIWWGELCTRPYMRARHNLGIALWDQGKYTEAIHEFKEMLRRNPNDNQGVRYLIGSLYHLSGNLKAALSYYKRAGLGGFVGVADPTNEFNHALALFQTKEYTAAVLQ